VQLHLIPAPLTLLNSIVCTLYNFKELLAVGNNDLQVRVMPDRKHTSSVSVIDLWSIKKQLQSVPPKRPQVANGKD
jgi:hypothetical protein